MGLFCESTVDSGLNVESVNGRKGAATATETSIYQKRLSHAVNSHGVLVFARCPKSFREKGSVGNGRMLEVGCIRRNPSLRTWSL